jgi:hypothetical protein
VAAQRPCVDRAVGDHDGDEQAQRFRLEPEQVSEQDAPERHGRRATQASQRRYTRLRSYARNQKAEAIAVFEAIRV